MIHLLIPYAVAALLVGLGLFGVVSRRNTVLVLIGIELILSGGLVLLVTSGLASGVGGDGHGRWAAASVVPLFVITIAAAEVVLALAIILALFRTRGSIDMDARLDAVSDSPPPPSQPGEAATEGAKAGGER